MTKRLSKEEKDRRYMELVREYQAAEEEELARRSVFTTTFCNKGHRLSDGKPVEHECYVLDPTVLQEEAYNGASAALDLVRSGERKMHHHKVHPGLSQEDVS